MLIGRCKGLEIFTSTASDKIKNAINTKNNPFTKPASTSARPYLDCTGIKTTFIDFRKRKVKGALTMVSFKRH